MSAAAAGSGSSQGPRGRRLRPSGLEARVHGMEPAPTPGTRSVELAGLAESLGYDHLWVYDHVETVPRREPTHVFEAFTTLAALSQRTSRIRLGQLVTCSVLPQRRASGQGDGLHRRLLRGAAHPRAGRRLVRRGVPGLWLRLPLESRAPGRARRDHRGREPDVDRGAGDLCRRPPPLRWAPSATRSPSSSCRPS